MSLFTSDNIVEFMSNNIVKCGVNNPINTQISANGTVKVRPIQTIGNIDGKPMGEIYWLDFVNPGEATKDDIEIYWVPYVGDDAPPPTLISNASRFMFTAVMSGCSLGIGSYAGGGTVGVTHANAKRSGDKHNTGLEGEPAMKQQKNVQQHMLYGRDTSKRIISYDKYMKHDGAFDMEIQSTTFGVHALNQPWKFYTLKYKYLGGSQYTHYGLEQQVSGII